MSSRPNTAQGSDKPFTRKNLATLAASLGSTNNPVYVSHKAQIAALAWSPSGKKLATASVDGNVRVWGVSIDTVHAVSRARCCLCADSLQWAGHTLACLISNV